MTTRFEEAVRNSKIDGTILSTGKYPYSDEPEESDIHLHGVAILAMGNLLQKLEILKPATYTVTVTEDMNDGTEPRAWTREVTLSNS